MLSSRAWTRDPVVIKVVVPYFYVDPRLPFGPEDDKTTIRLGFPITNLGNDPFFISLAVMLNLIQHLLRFSFNKVEILKPIY